MKNQILLILAIIAIFSSCSPGGGSSVTPTSGSTFNITLSGHTYNIVHSTTNVAMTATTVSEAANFSAQGYFQTTQGSTPGFKFTLLAGDKSSTSGNILHVDALLSGFKAGSSSAIGTYRTGGDATSDMISIVSVLDQADGGKNYIGCDTNSTITVTISNATEVKGTFDLNLIYNYNYSSTFHCTGSFDIFK